MWVSLVNQQMCLCFREDGGDTLHVLDLWPSPSTPLPWRHTGEHHPPGAHLQHPQQVQRHQWEGVQDLQGLNPEALRDHSPTPLHHYLLQGEITHLPPYIIIYFKVRSLTYPPTSSSTSRWDHSPTPLHHHLLQGEITHLSLYIFIYFKVRSLTYPSTSSSTSRWDHSPIPLHIHLLQGEITHLPHYIITYFKVRSLTYPSTSSSTSRWDHSPNPYIIIRFKVRSLNYPPCIIIYFNVTSLLNPPTSYISRWDRSSNP